MTNHETFRNKHLDEIKQLAQYYRHLLLEDVVPFWEERIVDKEQGGYFNCFTRTGKLYKDVKCGWFVGRDLYTFSALYNHVEKNPAWLRIAEEGRKFLKQTALNKNGRLNYMMNRDGSTINGEDSIFTDHFAVEGLFEYIEASGEKKDIPFAKQMFDTLMLNVSDKNVIAKECPYLGFRKHALNFMTLIVAMKGKKYFPDTMKPIIDKCLHDSLYVFADDKEKAILEYVSTGNLPLYEGPGRIFDPGHSFESLWFAMREGYERHDAAIIKRASELVDWVIDRAWDEEYGGFYQHVDIFDAIPEKPFLNSRYIDIDVGWADKIWWVQAEALYALALSALLTGNERHFQYFLKLHQFCKDYFSDPVYGEWYSVLKRDASVLSDRKGFELKGPYHVPRCAMQLTILFERYMNGLLA